MNDEPLRLGFPVKVMGEPGPQEQRHPALAEEPAPQDVARIRRRDPRLPRRVEHRHVPAVVGPRALRHPSRHAAVPRHGGGERRRARAPSARKARRLDIRLSFHPSQYILLNSPDPELTRKSIWDLSSQAEMLDRMGLGPEAVLVTHVGGVYGDREASRARWIEGWRAVPRACPAPPRARERRHPLLRRRRALDPRAHRRAAHLRLPALLVPEPRAAATCRRRWRRSSRPGPTGVRPKIHFSSPAHRDARERQADARPARTKRKG